jgi:hypothetical protein
VEVSIRTVAIAFYAIHFESNKHMIKRSRKTTVTVRTCTLTVHGEGAEEQHACPMCGRVFEPQPNVDLLPAGHTGAENDKPSKELEPKQYR